MNVDEAIELLRREQRVVSKSIEIYEELNLSDASKHEFADRNKKTIEALDMAIEALGGKEDEV